MITLTHYDSIPFRQTLCMCLLYHLVVSGGKEKGSFSSLSIYLGSYYTIEMIGSRYKSLEVYTKPWTQECVETQTNLYYNERQKKSFVVVSFCECLCELNSLCLISPQKWFALGKYKISSKKGFKVINQILFFVWSNICQPDFNIDFDLFELSIRLFASN